MNARSVELFYSRGQQLCKFIGKKRNLLHKKKIQHQKGWFGTPTWPPLCCFGTALWRTWRHVKTLYKGLFSYKLEWILEYSWEVKRWPLYGGLTVFARIEHRYHYDCLSSRFLLLRSTATASYHNEEQKWKHLVRKWQTKHCTQERIKGTEKASPLHTLFHR